MTSYTPSDIEMTNFSGENSLNRSDTVPYNPNPDTLHVLISNNKTGESIKKRFISV
jgi:hypothetical protein